MTVLAFKRKTPPYHFAHAGEALLTKTELARHLKVSPSTVNAYMRLPDPLPNVKLGEGRMAPVRFRLSEVAEWLDRRVA